MREHTHEHTHTHAHAHTKKGWGWAACQGKLFDISLSFTFFTLSYLLTAGVVAAPQMTSEPVSPIFL